MICRVRGGERARSHGRSVYMGECGAEHAAHLEKIEMCAWSLYGHTLSAEATIEVP